LPGSVLLIVVDNPAHRALFNRFLGGTPHHLVFASDGEDGFDRFGEVKPDLMIAHINVPRLDGTILCQLIRQQPRGSRIPYVLLGEELAMPAVGEARAEAVGADGYLPFPFDRNVLIERIMALLTFGRPDSISRKGEVATAHELRRPSTNGGSEPSGRTALDAPTESAASAATPLGSAAWVGDERLFEEPVAPQGPAASPHIDADTVVSFVNPFSGGADAPANAQVQTAPDLEAASRAETPVATESETHVELLEPPTPFGSNVLEGRTTQVGGEPTQPQQFLAPKVQIPEVSTRRFVPSTGPRGRDRVSRAGMLDSRGDDDSGADRFQEIPIDHAPARRDVLEEPQISNRGDTSAQKARMIEEPPREGTPSASERRVGGPDATGVRRGLDESQLGKRLAKRVRTMFRLLDEVDYYQMLGVDPEAGEQALKRAYFDLSLEFHPDRFFLLRSGDLKEKIYAIYRRITEAYSVLCDERRRSSYDEARFQKHQKRAAPELRNERGSDPPAPVPAPSFGEEIKTEDVMIPTSNPKAKRFVDLARASIVDGDINAARLHLHLALAYESDNVDLKRALLDVAKMARPAG
jgi:CheY-like chemotaxis protein